jgi:hypothetical protein
MAERLPETLRRAATLELTAKLTKQADILVSNSALLGTAVFGNGQVLLS